MRLLFSDTLARNSIVNLINLQSHIDGKPFKKYLFGKKWEDLSDLKKQEVSKRILVEFFEQIEQQETKSENRTIKIIYFNDP